MDLSALRRQSFGIEAQAARGFISVRGLPATRSEGSHAWSVVPGTAAEAFVEHRVAQDSGEVGGVRMTIDDIAKREGVARSTVRRWISSGVLKARQIVIRPGFRGGAIGVRIDVDDYQAFQ